MSAHETCGARECPLCSKLDSGQLSDPGVLSRALASIRLALGELSNDEARAVLLVAGEELASRPDPDLQSV